MSIRLTYRGHACFEIACEDYTIVADPYTEVPGYAALKLEAQEVLCSHQHFDHNAVETVTLLEGGKSPFVITEIDVPHDDCEGAKRGRNLIRIFEAEGLRVAHLGDVGCMPEPAVLEQLKGLDAVMIPVGGTFTVDAGEADVLADAIGAKVVIPMHYRLENLGFDSIGMLSEFTALRKDVREYPGNTVEITAGMPGQTAVLRYMP